MEHPVPQNVTSFEFHLVGDMTLKQFVYLASGVGLAYLIFVTLMGSAPLIAIPLIALFALGGVAFAFLPILDRPLDHWVAAFFRAVYTPTQAKWKATATPKVQVNKEDPAFKNRLGVYLSALEISPPQITPSAPPPVQLFGKGVMPDPSLFPAPAPSTAPVHPTEQAPVKQSRSPLPTHDELDKLVEMAKQAQMLQVKIAETEKQINQLKESAAKNNTGAQSFESQAKAAFENLHHLVEKAEALHEETAKISSIAAHKSPAPSPIPTKVVTPTPIRLAPNALPFPTVRKPISQPATPAGKINLTSSPNVINGIVTDTTGNYLEGVIVIIHNKEGIPVRALKSNKLGQFTGATPLPSGTYALTLEKDGLTFDTLKIDLTGEIIQPLNIAAKQGGVPNGQ